jgi:hypothetical protein
MYANGIDIAVLHYPSKHGHPDRIGSPRETGSLRTKAEIIDVIQRSLLTMSIITEETIYIIANPGKCEMFCAKPGFRPGECPNSLRLSPRVRNTREIIANKLWR